MKSVNDNKKSLDFWEICSKAALIPEIVLAFNTLTYSNLNIKSEDDLASQIEELKRFAHFFHDYIWLKTEKPIDCFAKEEVVRR
jgi:hypothetical protein